MKILADENIDQQIVSRLRSDGHDVSYVAEFDVGVDDETVLLKSRELGAILLTGDKDFGELVFRQKKEHPGIVLIRLAGLKAEWKAELVSAAFEKHGESLRLGFAVLSRRSLRVRKAPQQ